MKNQDGSWKVDAFVDGELDLGGQLEMEARVVADAALREQVDEARALREVIRANADRHAAPADLRARLARHLAQARPEAPAPTPARSRPLAETLQRWLGWRPLGAALSLATVLAVALNLVWMQTAKEERLSDEIVASHVRSTLGQHLVDVASSDHHTVKPFLSARLGFSPPVDELRLAGSAFLGGRVDYVDGRPVAALVYRQGEHVVNSFVWPSRAADSTPGFAVDRGYQIAHWSNGGMNHWVISDVNRQEFQALVRAIQAGDSVR